MAEAISAGTFCCGAEKELIVSYRAHTRKTGAPINMIVCALVFIVFSFLWLYFFQADVLAVAQHVLSGGTTHYNRTIGALLITAVLFILQRSVYAMTRLSRNAHALTYFPSMLALAVLSDIPADIDKHFSFNQWIWIIPLALILWAGCVWLAKQMLPFSKDAKEETGLFSRRMWLNIVQMAVMMIVVAMVSNSNAVFHFTAHAETALMKGDVDEALRVGKKSLETDENLTMLRIFALSKKGLLGESLFDYAVAGTSNDMLPMAGSKSRLRLMPDSLLWEHFGRQPETFMTIHRYLDSLETDTMASSAYRDYRLVGLLIDRQIDSFVVSLPRYYEVNDSLPRNYREALQVYQHQHDTIIYADTLMHAVWQEYILLDSIPTKSERKIRAADRFRSTYWYYYYQ